MTLAAVTATVSVNVRNIGSNIARAVCSLDVLPVGLELVDGQLAGSLSTIQPDQADVFSYTVRATQAGDLLIPSLQVTYQDPSSRKYASVSSASVVTAELPPPPELQLQANLNADVFDQASRLVFAGYVFDDQGNPAEASVAWRLTKAGQKVFSGRSLTGGGRFVVTGLAAPVDTGAYRLEFTASKDGFASTTITKDLLVQDSRPPTSPALILPEAGSYISTGRPQIRWQEAADDGDGVAGYQVEIDGIATDVTGSLYVPQTALSEGRHCVRIRAWDGAAAEHWSEWSPESTFIVDLTPPSVLQAVVGNPKDPQRSWIHSLSLQWTETLGTPPDRSILQLRNYTSREDVNLEDVGFQYDAGTRTATWDFSRLPEGSLPDGNYRARIAARSVQDLAGNLLDGNGDGAAGDGFMLAFHRLAGDADGNGMVDQADYTVWYNNYGRTGIEGAVGDFSGDGLVDQADYTLWYNAYGQSVPAGPHVVISDIDGSTSDRSAVFPETRIGEVSDARTFVLSNNGDQPLNITNFAASGDAAGDFVSTVTDDSHTLITGSSFSIPAGHTCSIAIACRPTAAGVRAAAVSFNVDDPDTGEAPIVLAISGIGFIGPRLAVTDTVCRPTTSGARMTSCWPRRPSPPASTSP